MAEFAGEDAVESLRARAAADAAEIAALKKRVEELELREQLRTSSVSSGEAADGAGGPAPGGGGLPRVESDDAFLPMRRYRSTAPDGRPDAIVVVDPISTGKHASRARAALSRAGEGRASRAAVTRRRRSADRQGRGPDVRACVCRGCGCRRRPTTEQPTTDDRAGARLAKMALDRGYVAIRLMSDSFPPELIDLIPASCVGLKYEASITHSGDAAATAAALKALPFHVQVCAMVCAMVCAARRRCHRCRSFSPSLFAVAVVVAARAPSRIPRTRHLHLAASRHLCRRRRSDTPPRRRRLQILASSNFLGSSPFRPRASS